VGYLPAGAGAVATTVQGKLRADDAGPTTVGNGTVPYALASFYSNKNITQHAWYDFIAGGTMDYTGNVEPIVGHASYNDNKTILGTLGFDHHHSYQAYPHYSASGVLARLSCFWALPDVTAGTVTELSQFKASNPLGAGTITNLYGLYIDPLTRGASKNYGIFSAGNDTPSYFGGGIELGRGASTYGSLKYLSTGSVVLKGRLDSGGFPIRLNTKSFTLGGSTDAVFDAVFTNNPATGDLEIGARQDSVDFRIKLNSAIGSKTIAEGGTLMGVLGVVNGCTFRSASGAAFSGADTAIYVAKNTVTSRSVNAAGTINASGADYAEYECNNGLSIAKGSIVGFKADGTLTLTYTEAIRFAVKSTDPSYVGGDTWGVGLEGDALEAARQLVDRIAYSGKVPVNAQGATPGGYIVAVADDAGAITGEFVADPDFTQYKKAVGRVNRILADGRAEIAVIIH